MFISKKQLKMKKEQNIEVKVCIQCDAPLPFRPLKYSYFNSSKSICDDCYKTKK